MERFRAKTDEESIESLRRIQGKKSLLRLFFGAMGIVMFTFFFMFLGLVNRITADIDIDIVRRCAFAGFACGALFRPFAMLMVLQGVLALMKVCQRDQKSRHLMHLKSVWKLTWFLQFLVADPCKP